MFGPLPRDYSYRLPSGARRRALCVALSAKNREGRLIVVDRLEVASGKTRDMAKALAGLDVCSALLVLAGRDEKVERAARNLPRIKTIEVAGVNVYDLLGHEHVVFTTEALKALEERLSR